jgi:hypothetical protein
MGAGGPGAFENDAALDFVPEIEAAKDLADALTIRTLDQPIDADTACRIVVVAECVAAMRGHPCHDMPDGLAERLATFGKPSRSLFHHARDHLAAVMTRSELMELWAEGDPARSILRSTTCWSDSKATYGRRLTGRAAIDASLRQPTLRGDARGRIRLDLHD